MAGPNNGHREVSSSNGRGSDAAEQLRQPWADVRTTPTDAGAEEWGLLPRVAGEREAPIRDGAHVGPIGRPSVRPDSLARADRAQAALLRHQAGMDLDAAAKDRGRAALLRHQAAIDQERAAGLLAQAETEREAAAEERAAARIDELTGVLGRRAGLDELQREVDRCQRTEERLVLGFLDIDGLKAVNDTLGHLAGDDVIRQVATALRSSVRSYDMVMRYGGDEFVYALPGAGLPDARRRFARLLRSLKSATGGTSVTVGLAELQPHESVGDLIGRADQALYSTRRSSRCSAAPQKDGEAEQRPISRTRGTGGVE